MKRHNFIILLVLSGCWVASKNNLQLSKIDLNKIEIAEIKKRLYDTISVQLSPKQIEKLVSEINNTKGTNLIKAMPAYWIFVKFKNDSISVYKLIDGHLGEYDLYIDIDTKKYEEIYDSGPKKRHLIPWKNQ